IPKPDHRKICDGWRRKPRTGSSTERLQGNKVTELIEQGTAWLRRAKHKLATGAVLASLCLVAYHFIFAANGLLAFHQKKAESKKLEQEIQTLQQDNARREQQIKALKSEPQAIEKEARERLRYARPGEVVYTLPTPQPTPDKKK